MLPSLDLTPARGPSVWARMERERKMDRGWLAMIIIGGAVLVASVLRRPAIERAWTVALGLACVAVGCFSFGCPQRLSAALERLQRLGGGPVNDAIDRASANSFPASDAPSSSTSVCAPRR